MPLGISSLKIDHINNVFSSFHEKIKKEKKNEEKNGKINKQKASGKDKLLRLFQKTRKKTAIIFNIIEMQSPNETNSIHEFEIRYGFSVEKPKAQTIKPFRYFTEMDDICISAENLNYWLASW